MIVFPNKWVKPLILLGCCYFKKHQKMTFFKASAKIVDFSYFTNSKIFFYAFFLVGGFEDGI